MKTENEIREMITTLENAIKDEGYKPVADGKRLQEHIYHQRVGAITFLKAVLNEDEYEDIPEEYDAYDAVKVPLWASDWHDE